MQNKVVRLRPSSLFVGVVVVFVGLLLSRKVSEKEDFPAFLSKNEKNIYAELTFENYGGGVYQINDDMTLCDVIYLTGVRFDKDFKGCRIPLVNGDRFVLLKKAQGIEIVERGWMDAGKRIALSIPLHPDNMKHNDWIALPGIGEKLAHKIEADRQINGDFVDLKQLVRVKGIGQKRVESWQKYFHVM